MKLYKNLLRIWIAIGSVAAFAVGWIGLAHAPKPIQSQSSTAATTTSTQLDPLPAMPSLSQIQQQSVSPAPLFSSSQVSSQPVFRSRGS